MIGPGFAEKLFGDVIAVIVVGTILCTLFFGGIAAALTYWALS